MRLFFNNFILVLTARSGDFAFGVDALKERDVSASLVTKVQNTARGLVYSDLPWDDLRAKVNPSTVLLDEIPESVYETECIPAIKLGLNATSLMNDSSFLVKPGFGLALKHDTPSGVCMMNFFCALENCGLDTSDEDATVGEKISTAWVELWENYDFSMFDQSNNPNYNLPSTVLFPQNAGDVVAAINFAREHSLEVSIKTSGHSFTGSSTKKDTLHLNMREFEKFSSIGIVECSDEQDAVVEDDLSNQPCKFALARNKPAVIHVGGGEDWSDVYTSVKSFNDLQESYKYHAVGGNVGSVSPQGWTWQGGLGGTTGGRKYGFGVDHVAQIEMVLPSGLHVLFGPTSWEDADGFEYPRTTKVSGVCKDETGVWGPCQDNVNFDDLWFAQRGGLGGTWGVVVSMYLVLMEFESFELVLWTYCQEMDGAAQHKALVEFTVNLLVDPSAIGLTEDDTLGCGSPGEYSVKVCYGEGISEKVVTAWTAFIIDQNQTLHKDGGLSYEQINEYANCAVNNVETKDLGDMNIIPPPGPYAGSIGSTGMDMGLIGNNSEQNIILPKKWMIANKDKAVSLLAGEGARAYHAFGGPNTSDQLNALSEAHRGGGVMYTPEYNRRPFDNVVDAETFYSEWLPEMYDFTDSDNFPGYFGSNHASSGTLGPLKNDWTKPCPMNWTEVEREEKCISLQEAIFGTKLLQRLEGIKETIDPNYMFNCNRCVGNNHAKTSESTDSTEGIEDEEMLSKSEDEEIAPQPEVKETAPQSEVKETAPQSEVDKAAPPSEDSGCQGPFVMVTVTVLTSFLVGWMVL